MATTNPIVTSLPEYVEQNRLPLITKSVLGNISAKMFNLQKNVKGKTAINLLETETVFQDANDCGFNAEGSQTLSQRYLDPAYLKVNMQWCPRKLLGTWAQHKVKIAAGQKVLPFEEEFVNDIVKHVNEKLEYLIYFGDSTNEAEFDGIIKNIKDNAISAEGADTKWGTIKNVYEAIPETEIKDDTVILVSKGYFRGFIQELVTANLYHYNPNDGAYQYYLPGTNVMVKGVDGLISNDDKDYIIGGRASNIFIGVDMDGDNEKFDLWYTKNLDLFRLNIEFMYATQVAFPDKVVLYVSGEGPGPGPEPDPYNGLLFENTSGEANMFLHMSETGNPDPISLQYTVDGTTWNDFPEAESGETWIEFTDKIAIKAKEANVNGTCKYYNYNAMGDFYEIHFFNDKSHGMTNVDVKVSGDIRYLINANPETVTTIPEHAFAGLFHAGAPIGPSDASELILPFTTLSEKCYMGLFNNCENLTKAPQLPATTLAKQCYAEMFMYCDNLTEAPELPATTLAEGCYDSMFHNCAMLTEAPELMAETLTDECYGYMFNGCTALTSVKCYAKDIDYEDCVTNWLEDVALTGTLYRNPELTENIWENKIPDGWILDPTF